MKLKGYNSVTQQKNIAWFLPRPKPDKYKGGMPLYSEDWLLELGKELVKESNPKILNLFCGKNKQGFRIDINPNVKPDYLGDAHSFAGNINDKKFNIILADPPYSNKESKELYGTGKINYKNWTSECDKVLKDGGLLIVYHKYIMPNPNSQKYEVVKRVFIGSRIRHLPRVAIFFKKKGVKNKTTKRK